MQGEEEEEDGGEEGGKRRGGEYENVGRKGERKKRGRGRLREIWHYTEEEGRGTTWYKRT